MAERNLGKIVFSLFKVAVFLGFGTFVGFGLGLAYASHLYGTPPVVAQIQSWLAGDVLYESPSPVDQTPVDQLPVEVLPGHPVLKGVRKYASELMSSPVSIIPKIGACLGFGIATSVLIGSLSLRFFAEAVRKKRPG